MVERESKSLGSFDQDFLSIVQSPIDLSAHTLLDHHTLKPRMLPHQIPHQFDIISPKNSPRCRSSDSAKCGAESLPQPQSPLCFSVLFFNDETVGVYANALRGNGQGFNLTLQDYRVNQTSCRN